MFMQKTTGHPIMTNRSSLRRLVNEIDSIRVSGGRYGFVVSVIESMQLVAGAGCVARFFRLWYCF